MRAAINIHPLEAPDRRASKRISFYKGEFPDAKVEFAGRTYEADVYDLSSDGVGILPRREIPGLDSIKQKVVITFVGGRPSEATLQRISHIKFSGSLRLKLGFSLDWPEQNLIHESEKFYCSDCMPMAYCDDPIAFNRTLMMNITYFASNVIGARVNIADAGLFRGMCLDLRLMMPARGEYRVAIEIIGLQVFEEHTEIDCLLANPTNELRNSISEFLLMTTAGLTIKELSSKGFLTTVLEKAFLFRCAQKPEQFTEILKLRLKAAQKDGRWLEESDCEKMRDSWDKHARQIFCEINGQIVAAGRIVFNNGLKDRSEHVSYGVDIPRWLWEEGFVEASRVCTDPDFRGSDIFMQVLQHISRIITQSNYRYLVLNCADSLVPVYKKAVGVIALNQRFYTPFMKDKALNLLCVDVRAAQIGSNMTPSSWILNVPVGSYLVAMGKLKLKWWEKVVQFVAAGLYRVIVTAYRRKKR